MGMSMLCMDWPVTAQFGDIKDRLLDTNVTVKQY